MLDRLDDLNEILRSEQNRLESQQNRQICHQLSQKSIQDNIIYLQKQIEILDDAIKNHIDTHLKEQVKNLKTVPGVGNKISPHLLVAMHRFGVLTDGNGTNKAIVAYYGNLTRVVKVSTKDRVSLVKVIVIYVIFCIWAHWEAKG